MLVMKLKAIKQMDHTEANTSTPVERGTKKSNADMNSVTKTSPVTRNSSICRSLEPVLTVFPVLCCHNPSAIIGKNARPRNANGRPRMIEGESLKSIRM